MSDEDVDTWRHKFQARRIRHPPSTRDDELIPGEWFSRRKQERRVALYRARDQPAGATMKVETLVYEEYV